MPKLPHEALKAFKSTVRKAAKLILKNRNLHDQHPLTVLTGAIRLLRHCETGEDSAHEAQDVFQKYPALGRLFGYEFTYSKRDKEKLVDYMDGIAEEGIAAGTVESDSGKLANKGSKFFWQRQALLTVD